MNSIINESALIPAILMSVLAGICLTLVLAGLNGALARTGWPKQKQNRILIFTGLGLSVWVLIISVLALKGFFNDYTVLPPRPVFVILIPLPIVLIICFSKGFKEILKATPPQWIIMMQGFRIFVELMLWNAVMKQLLPVQMSFEGRNFDILSGILAIPVGYFCFIKKSWGRKIAIAYNIIGLILLLNILIIAVLSIPTPFRYFMNEPANTLVGYFPFIFLPAILVVLAYSLHIFSLRQLLMKK